MTERTPWWKSFLPKKRSGGPKESMFSGPFGPDFDPFAQESEKRKDPSAAASKTSSDQSPSQASNKSSSLLREETYDDSQLESYFNERTCRRNMKVSRSGRFKEKRKPRSTLPIEEKETENAAGKEDVR